MMRVVLAGAAMLASPLAAEEWPPAVTAAVETARAECAGFEQGVLDFPETAISRVDLTGDGTLNWVVDTAQAACSSAASLFCGTGGCAVNFIVGDRVADRLARGWAVVPFGDAPVLLLDVHGSLCGGINPTPCVEALVWDDEAGAFFTLAPRPE